MENDKEKLLIYFAIGVIAVIFLIVLVIIWMPEKVDSSKFTRYGTSNEYISYAEQMYKNELIKLLNINNSSSLLEKINEKFLTNNGLTNDTVIEYLQKNFMIGNDIEILSVETASSADVCVFRYEYSCLGQNKYLQIIEKSPYEYTISFEQSSTELINVEEKVVNEGGIEFVVKPVSSTANSLKYDITINNKSTDNYKFDFSSLNSVQLILNDGSRTNLASTIIGIEDNYELSQNSSLKNELVFNIPFSNQGKVQGIRFNYVEKNHVEEPLVSIDVFF